VTKLERWQRFSLIYVWGMLAVIPAWVEYIPDPYLGFEWRRLAPVLVAPLVQIALALKLHRPSAAYAYGAVIAGGLAAYSAAWVLLIVLLMGVAVFVTPLLAGAALGQVVASLTLHLWRRLAALCDEQAEGVTSALSSAARVTVSAAASIAGAFTALVLFYLLYEYAHTVYWTDAIYILPLAASLGSLAACAAFLVWFLGREGG
jgi:hypothetical protein